jgi:hypothetical protein
MKAVGWPIVSPWAPPLDQHRPDPADARPEAHIDQKDLGLRTVSAEDLGAVDDEVIPVGRSGGGKLGDCRPRLGFGHAERDQRTPTENVGQEAGLLLGRAVFRKGAHRAEVAGLDDIAGPGADFGHRLDGKDRIDERAALAAVGLGNRDSHQAHFGEAPRHVPRVFLCAGARGGAGRELRLGKPPHGILEHLLFLGEPEVHALPFGSFWNV